MRLASFALAIGLFACSSHDPNAADAGGAEGGSAVVSGAGGQAPTGGGATSGVGGAIGNGGSAGPGGGTAGTAGLDSGWSWVKVKNLSHFMDSVWGSSATDVYTVGGFGYLMHSTGHDDWVTSQLPVKDDAKVIAGSGPDDVFVANKYGKLFHLKGGVWTELTLPEGNTYASQVWALDSDNVFLLAGGDLLRGSAAGNWEIVPTPENTNGIDGVWGSSAENLYLLGDAIWHKTATSDWTAELKPSPMFLSGSSAANVYATLLDKQGSIFHSTGDGNWTEVPVPFRTGEVPTCIFSVDDTTTFVGGNKSGVYVSDANGQWKLIGVGAGGSHHAIWAPSRDEVYAVGLDGVTHGRRQ